MAVVNGSAYEDFARDMFESARERFRPTEDVRFRLLRGFGGWPNATMLRPAVLLKNLPATDYVFLIDADMVVHDVGPEILPPHPLGVTATLHPGYVGKPEAELPYDRSDSETRIDIGEFPAPFYYAGGFFGGAIAGMALLLQRMVWMIDTDARNGIVPAHHDESALNRVLAEQPPDVSLHPGFCNPQEDSWYRSWWPEQWPRRITALDKSAEVRALRETA